MMTHKYIYAFIISATVAMSGTVAEAVPHSSHRSIAPKQVSDRHLPPELGDCTLTIIGRKPGTNVDCSYKMGYNAPMPKLKVFLWEPKRNTAMISFDGVGDGCAVHFCGTLTLKDAKDNTYIFTAQGEMVGAEGEPAHEFTATPHTIIITLNPEV